MGTSSTPSVACLRATKNCNYSQLMLNCNPVCTVQLGIQKTTCVRQTTLVQSTKTNVSSTLSNPSAHTMASAFTLIEDLQRYCWKLRGNASVRIAVRKKF